MTMVNAEQWWTQEGGAVKKQHRISICFSYLFKDSTTQNCYTSFIIFYSFMGFRFHQIRWSAQSFCSSAKPGTSLLAVPEDFAEQLQQDRVWCFGGSGLRGEGPCNSSKSFRHEVEVFSLQRHAHVHKPCTWSGTSGSSAALAG